MATQSLINLLEPSGNYIYRIL